MNVNSFKFWRSWPVTAIIFEKRHGTERIVFDKATRRKDSSGHTYHLKYANKHTKPVEYDDIYPSYKGNVVLLYSPDPDTYTSMQKEEVSLKVEDDPFLKQWFSDRVKEQHETWQKPNTMAKWLPMILIIATGCVLAILFLMNSDSYVKMSKSASEASSSWAAAGERFAYAADRFTDLVIIMKFNDTAINGTDYINRIKQNIKIPVGTPLPPV